jgi:hypothetical protein
MASCNAKAAPATQYVDYTIKRRDGEVAVWARRCVAFSCTGSSLIQKFETKCTVEAPKIISTMHMKWKSLSLEIVMWFYILSKFAENTHLPKILFFWDVNRKTMPRGNRKAKSHKPVSGQILLKDCNSHHIVQCRRVIKIGYDFPL